MANSGGDNQQQPKLWTPVFVVVIAITFCGFIMGQGTNAGSTVYVDRLGSSATLAGLGATVFSVAAAVSRIVSGPLADARGRLIVMIVGAAIFVAGLVGPAATADIDLFLGWRFLQGIGFAALTTSAATAAADVLPVERLGEGIGYSGLGQALAMAIGPALAITLVSTDPPENLYWGLSIAGVCAIVLCLFCRYEKHPGSLPPTATYRVVAERRAEEQAEGASAGATEGNGSVDAGQRQLSPDGGAPSTADDAQVPSAASQAAGDASKGAAKPVKRSLVDTVFEPGALAGGIPMMVISPVLGFIIFFAGLIGTHMGVPNAGIFYTLTAVSMVSVRLASKSFMDNVPAIKIHAMAVAGALVAFVMLIIVVSVDMDPLVRMVLFYLAGLPYGLCPGLSIPINQAVAVKNSKPERWGAANGLFLLLMDVAIGIAATVWGITNDMFGFSFTICCVMVFAVASVLAARLWYPEADKHFR